MPLLRPHLQGRRPLIAAFSLFSPSIVDDLASRSGHPVSAKENFMAHHLAQLAYVGETPWYGLGNALPPKQSIDIWQKEAGLDRVQFSSSGHWIMPCCSPPESSTVLSI